MLAIVRGTSIFAVTRLKKDLLKKASSWSRVCAVHASLNIASFREPVKSVVILSKSLLSRATHLPTHDGMKRGLLEHVDKFMEHMCSTKASQAATAGQGCLRGVRRQWKKAVQCNMCRRNRPTRNLIEGEIFQDYHHTGQREAANARLRAQTSGNPNLRSLRGPVG